MMHYALASLVPILTLAEEPLNLAAGHRVMFLPQPNYAITSDGHDDTDLTDGRLSSRLDQRLWMDPAAVGWCYTPCIRAAVDLGEPKCISRVKLHLMGGGATDGADFPTWARLTASENGMEWFELDRFDGGGPTPAGMDPLPPSSGEAWTRWLLLAKQPFRARYVGVELGGTGFTCMDEFQIMGCATSEVPDPAALSGRACQYAIAAPSVSFMKQSLHGATDVFLPQPFQVLGVTSAGNRMLRLRASFPRDLEFGGLVAGGRSMQVTSREVTSSGRISVTAELPLEGGGLPSNLYCQIFVRRPTAGIEPAELRIWVDGQDERYAATVPISFHELPARGPLTAGFMTTLGWYPLALLQHWPQRLTALQRLGINTASMFANEVELGGNLPAMLGDARAAGFEIAMVDSPWHVLLERARGDPEPRCQVTGGIQYCLSYDGPRLETEMRRISLAASVIQPNYYFADIELWPTSGPSESKLCERCRRARSIEPSTILDQWYLDRGTRLWNALSDSLKSASHDKAISLGAYDFRAGFVYQGVWPVDRLLREGALQSVQPSYYSGLLPRDIRLVGDLARDQAQTLRRAFPGASCYVWLTPGDAGAVTRESMRCAIMACFAGGARGVLFWTQGCWDGEGLLGLSDALSTIAPVREVLQRGIPHGVSCADKSVSAAAWRLGDQLMIHVGRYGAPEGGTVDFELEVPKASEVHDCSSGRVVAEAGPGRVQITVNLGPHRSAMFLLTRKAESSAR
jgi:hypothetical protein